MFASESLRRYGEGRKTDGPAPSFCFCGAAAPGLSAITIVFWPAASYQSPSRCTSTHSALSEKRVSPSSDGIASQCSSVPAVAAILDRIDPTARPG
jgi:hypothetical protein